MTSSGRIFVVGISGASGAAYSLRLLEILLAQGHEVHLVVSEYGRRLLFEEAGIKNVTLVELVPQLAADCPGRLVCHPDKDVGAVIASGSFLHDGMVVLPCSSTSLGQMAHGSGSNLLCRAAMVTLKERRPLIVCHREMPLSLIDIESMRLLAMAGATICSPNPGFYLNPTTVAEIVDFTVGKVLDLLKVPHDLKTRWEPSAVGGPPFEVRGSQCVLDGTLAAHYAHRTPHSPVVHSAPRVSTPPIQLTTPVEAIPGITPRQAEGLRLLGISNLGRLIAYLPMRHEKIEAEASIADLAPEQIASARGQITATRMVRTGRRPRFEAVLHDGSARLDLVWFNMLFLRERVVPGVRLRVQGKVKSRGGGLQMANPKWDVLRAGEEEPEAQDEHMRPVYSATEEFKSWQVAKAIKTAAPLALPLIEDHLPETFRRERNMPELREAYRMQHAAADETEVAASRRRLAYDELLMLQLGVHMKRAHLRETLKAPALKWNAGIDKHIRERLPFALTKGQEEAVKEIAADLASPTPANRLLQGDVGAGKTVVALYAMLMAVASGHQASLMAPTEILAEQHFGSISAMLAGSRVTVELLTGTTGREQRESILSRLAEGTLDILIGTHALLTETVKFKNLAVAIVDEQHRFGVVQRAGLRAKASDEHSTPHVLVMTATPIPRTLAITLFGDLDISTISGLPPGRRPIKTKVVSPEKRHEVYEEINARINLGQQAYVVVPAIDASGPLPDLTGAIEETQVEERTPLRDCRTVAGELERIYLPGRRIAMMHGQLSRAVREQIMERFRQKQIDVLVATTVIEVGVDVPNATVMVVEQADRFGLAKLHQLRGRVGRGAADSLCYLIAEPTTEEATERLKVLAKTTDGFELAEKDLEIRGPGEVFGSRQSGLPPFKVADLTRDRELLGMARRDAAAWIGASPHLGKPEEKLLLRRTIKTFGTHLGLADVG